ncbi:putative MFS family arabinose efflux permease [Bradyrhizobium japonicum]
MRQYIDPILHRRRERLVRVIALATFVVFFQAYMVAPIIPVLSNAFGVSDEKIGLVVPAYLIPYGVSTLIYGAVADRIGIARVMFTSMLAFSALTMLTATARSYEELLLWRTITGVGASGIVPLGLALVGRLYPYGQRGRPLGWLFGAMAGGMAFGSPLGALIIPVTNWSGLFIVVGVFGLALLLPWLRYLTAIETTVLPLKGTVYQVFDGYRHLLGTPRGQRTYGYVFLNSMFHSGVFTWLGVYLERRYHLGPAAIGLALLGYGIPGFLLGPLIGRAADRWGRARLIPIGLILSSLAAMALALGTPGDVHPDRRNHTVLGVRHDPTAFWWNRYVSRRRAGRPGHGAERIYAFCRLRARKPDLRRAHALRLYGRIWCIRDDRIADRPDVLWAVSFRGDSCRPDLTLLGRVRRAAPTISIDRTDAAIHQLRIEIGRTWRSIVEFAAWIKQSKSQSVSFCR